MFFNKNKSIIFSLFLVFSFALTGLAQKKTSDNTPLQRLEIMQQKLDTMRRSLGQRDFGFKR